MKKIYIFALCAFVSAQVWGQTQKALLISPKDSFYVLSGVDSAFATTATIKNITGTSLDFTWERTEVSKTGIWEISTCDPTSCFGPKTTTAKFTLAANATGTMIIDGTPTSAGIIKLKILLTAKGYPTQMYKVTFKTGTTVGVNDAILNKIAIAPNPVQDNFRLVGFDPKINQLQIMDVMCKIVSSFEASENTNYDISDLQKGAYFVNLLDANGSRLGSKKLVKIN